MLKLGTTPLMFVGRSMATPVKSKTVAEIPEIGDGRVYTRHRPRYTPAFLDYLFSEAGFGAESNVADIGSGTEIRHSSLLA